MILNIFQSTLPREERLHRYGKYLQLWYFNPRSHERSDRAGSKGASERQDFNPRSHERSDHTQFAKIPLSDISIHAPTRGATYTKHYDVATYIFQSTLPREERQLPAHSWTRTQVFQSTLPREERQQYCTKNLFIFIQYRQ